MNVSRAQLSAHSSDCSDVNGWSGAEPGSAVLGQNAVSEGAGFPRRGLCLSLGFLSAPFQVPPNVSTRARMFASAAEPAQLCVIKTIRTAQNSAEVCSAMRLQAGRRRTMSACTERGGLGGFPPACAGSSGLAVLECIGNDPLQSIFPPLSSNLAAALLGNRSCRNSGHMLLVYLSGM